MNIDKRLAALESAVQVQRGFRTFEQIGDTNQHIETTMCVFDHSLDIQAGLTPAFVTRWTSAEIAALNADGWRCIVITRTPKQPNTRIASVKRY